MSENLDSSPVAPGDVLAGKYRVESVLGIGGMGVVVSAMHLQLQQTVALKFALPSALQSDQAVERFLREARAAVRLKSEHVAKVLDVGTLESGAPYMVMEFLDGSDLGGVLAKEGPLPVAAAADYVLQACEAVAEAHSLGIIHRDLKPQNLFLTQSVGGAALVKVLDFGISKMTMGIDSNLTKTSSVMGSPLYMAPEQMRSARNADARSDIWALGVILYELLSADVPFNAETMPELCLRVVQDVPRPIIALRPDVPAALNAAVMKCLEKDPKARFQDAGELASALEPFAPVTSRNAAARARMVLSKEFTRGQSPSMPAIEPPVQATTNAAVTGDAKPAVEQVAKKKSPILFIAGAVVVVLLAVGLGMKIAMAPTPAAAAAASSSQATTAPPAVITAPPATATTTAAPALSLTPPIDTAAASGSASASSSAKTKVPPPAYTSGPVAPPPTLATAAPTAPDPVIPRTRH